MFGLFKRKSEERYESILSGDGESGETENAAAVSVAEEIEGPSYDYIADNDDVLESGEVLTPDNAAYVQLSDEELYFEATGLQDTVLTVRLGSPRSFDTDKYLERLEQLPYEFRHYLDTRRAFSRGLKTCAEEISDFESYEGGKTALWLTSFDFDDAEVTLEFELSRAGDNEEYVFTVKITVEAEN